MSAIGTKQTSVCVATMSAAEVERARVGSAGVEKEAEELGRYSSCLNSSANFAANVRCLCKPNVIWHDALMPDTAEFAGRS